MLSTVLELLKNSREELLRLQTDLVAIPALGPTNAGQGEKAKVEYLAEYASRFAGVRTEMIKAPDDRVECGYRPSLIVRRPGKSPRTLWLIAHTDVVPTGDLSLWESDPFVLRQEGDLIYGRGVEDNHQGMVSALLLLRALETVAARTDLSLGILLAADEETGNTYGIEYIMTHHPQVFAPNDLIVIPDFGTPAGDAIEVAEKSVLWLRFTVQGRQCHASTPEAGVNSLVGASALILALDRLHTVFDACDPLFDPPMSTFAPTKMEANVPNVNTIPGQDVFHLDCRVLPSYPLEEIEQEIRLICDKVEAERGVRIAFAPVVREQAAPATPADCEAAERLTAVLEKTRGLAARAIGIGGGTVAAAFRKRGLPAVCWSTLMHTAHQPNEHASVTATLADARVFAHLLFEDQA
ncbi:M20 family metallo-hydrolase [Desulfomicrobium baculatum]|uniref:Acetylornithine deacetylase or succinyl-diaminopimelate desuccinylase n=1 Tax=Desulfomicrobium baculatum (strain DSM 4028 / VKM B-1378 / X) TaxID=525897 RepID=C7LNG6_DESBD|nr:M20 family metallo-hydrolase [Desulfomicrobium baculatum]ACU90135.1 acetylornithine deacetylase or succinyl- diaminopimelate desuccinylase [Desulfomicrobium baculatum DSM 4028]